MSQRTSPTHSTWHAAISMVLHQFHLSRHSCRLNQVMTWRCDTSVWTDEIDVSVCYSDGWIVFNRFGIRTMMVYLETLHQGFYPFLTFSFTFFLFIYICAILGQQLFSGEFSSCSNSLIVVREECNTQVCWVVWCERIGILFRRMVCLSQPACADTRDIR